MQLMVLRAFLELGSRALRLDLGLLCSPMMPVAVLGIILNMKSPPRVVTEVDILNDLVAPDEPDLSPESARAILELRFRQRAIDRMSELAEKNRQGILTDAERNELDRYLRVGNFLNLLQGKARKSLSKVS
ncbi:MAG: hypothetical protein HY721_23945 [Planctomycetes bacterium]|nr:hypothetical protein [Planctomycetota bacterium]